MNRVAVLVAALLLAACGEKEAGTPVAPDATPPQEQSVTMPAAEPQAAEPSPLAQVLEAQPEEVKARYPWRHPQETLDFFGIKPGMTVVEVLPGEGWYTKILLPYLGSEGHLIGVDYPQDIFPLFGFLTEQQIEARKTWTEDWTAEAEGWRGPEGARVSAFVFGSMPESLRESADAVLIIRALHNLARFEGEGGFLTAALADIHAVLAPGGIVGVVQHEARPEMPDDWAGGAAGYLKKGWVIDQFQQAGFEFVAESPINENAADQPTAEDQVWRLPPSLATSADQPELREKLQAVGESHRMTLLFRKPAGG